MPDAVRESRVVDWDAGERRRHELERELDRVRRLFPGLGVGRALLFGSLVEGSVGAASDLDLILIVTSAEPFPARCARFYEALAPRVGMDLLVYTPEEFAALRDRPFFRTALARARVVYAE